MINVQLSVPDMKCDGCVEAVQSALAVLATVQRADVSLAAKIVDVDLEDDGSTDELIEAIASAGYKAALTD
jgi:copper chaperone CopZ